MASIIQNETHETHASDSEDESVEGNEGSDVEDSSLQIGFAEPVGDELMFEDANWKEWDGGRIGGKPFWLNPKNLPPPKKMECEHCKEPMSFVLQIYCPLDDVPGAFHRMLYMFCCKRAGCMNKGSVKALRCQLSRKNKFFSENAVDGSTIDISNNKSVCAVCGFNGPLTCSACKQESYCSKSHQKLAWKAQHKASCGKLVVSETSVSHRYNCVFPEFEIEVCNSDEIDDADEEKALLLVKEEKKQREEAEATLMKLQKASIGDGSELMKDTVEEMTEMAKMRQKDIIGREGVESDAMRDQTTFNFMLKVAAAKDQVLRYDRWKGSPLWIKSSATKSAETVPKCKCGALRKFEFQVMPQLIHFLGTDADIVQDTDASLSQEAAAEKLKQISQDTLDWGVLAVYTCSESCEETEESDHYSEEFVYRQPPL